MQAVAGEGLTRCVLHAALSLLALESALELWADVDLAQVRAKGLSLTGFFIECVDELLPPGTVELLTPRNEQRGHQVSLRCAGAEAVMADLIAREIIGDYRAPDALRFGFAPLYVSHADAFNAARGLADILASAGPEHV